MIELPRVATNACWIGPIVDVVARDFRLQETNLDAWRDRTATKRKLTDVRRVQWGDAYTRSLDLFGGPPPPLDPELEG